MPLRALVVGLAAAIVSIPTVVGANRSDKDPSAERAAVRAKQADVATQVDALRASDTEIEAALAALEANVAGQQARVAEARRAAQAAQEALEAATAAVEAKRAEIEALRAEIREFAVEAFIHPPADDAMQALQADNPSESATKRALLELQNESDADLLDRLSAAEEDLAVKQAESEQAKVAADTKQAEVENRLAELTAARDQQAAFGAAVQARLDRALAEAAHLASVDAELSRKIAAQQAELARRAAAALPRSGSARPVSIGPGPGGLATVSCPGGGSITVASSIADNTKALLEAAAGDGLMLCGGGYRDPQAQVELRRAHCGSSDYAVYQMPSSQCSPPTAPPGTSMHEQGLAIDFNNCSSRSTACYQWLSRNAGSFGFQNLPSEPWHWSTNGN